MKEEKKKEEPNKNLNRTNKNTNVLNIILGFITVLSLLFAVYSHVVNKKIYELSYYVSPQSYKIYSHTNVKNLILYEADSNINTRIESDVHIIDGKVWNSGDYIIDKNNIREPLKLKLSNIDRIIEYKIITQNTKDSLNFTLSKVRETELDIDWKYLDPKNGFSFQITYVGTDSVNIEMAGEIAYIDTFKKHNKRMHNDMEDSELFLKLIIIIVLVGGGSMLGIHYIRKYSIQTYKEVNNKGVRYFIYFMLLGAFVILVFLIKKTILFCYSIYNIYTNSFPVDLL